MKTRLAIHVVSLNILCSNAVSLTITFSDNLHWIHETPRIIPDTNQLATKQFIENSGSNGQKIALSYQSAHINHN